MLNRAIGQFVRPDLWHDKDSGSYFFAKQKNRDNLRYSYKSLQSFVPRYVVRRYGKKRVDPSQASYWRHSAFLHRFIRFDSQWFVEITPTYHFTRDGYKPDTWGGDRLKAIKECENNAAVMGQFVMWRYFLLNHGAEDLYASGYPYLSFAPINELCLDVGVPDDLWKMHEANPNSPLFDWAQAEALE